MTFIVGGNKRFIEWIESNENGFVVVTDGAAKSADVDVVGWGGEEEIVSDSERKWGGWR